MAENTHGHIHAAADETPRKWERAAAYLSALCAVHCLLLPLVTGVLPALGASQMVQLGSSLDLGLSAMVVVSVGAGALWGFRRHRDLRVASAMGVGLLFYLLGHSFEGSRLGTSLSIAGALILAAASFASTRLSQHCDHAH